MASKLSPVTLVLRGVDRITGTVNKVNARLTALQKPVRDLSRAFQKLDQNTGFTKVLGRIQGVGSSLAALARRAFFAGSALTFAAGAGMRRFISSADELDEAAAAAGVSVEKLQEIRFAGSFNGLGAGQVDKLLIRFSRTLGEAKRGTGALTAVLKKSNPELLKQFRTVKSTDEGFDLLIRTLQRIPDQRLRNVLAVAAAGRGAEKITLLADSFDVMADKARALGVVLDRETVDRAVQAQDALQELGFVGKGLGMIVASELLPVVLEVTKRISAWVNENRALIRTEVPKFARQVADGVAAIANFVAVSLPKVTAFIDKIGGLKTVLIAVAAVMAGPVINSLFALSAALLTTPFGWVVLGLGAIATTIALIIANWDTLMAKFDAVPPWMRTLATSLAGAVPGLGGVGSAASLFDSARGGLSGLFGGGGGKTEVGGKIQLEISGAPVKSKGMESFGGINLELLGPAMVGF